MNGWLKGNAMIAMTTLSLVLLVVALLTGADWWLYVVAYLPVGLPVLRDAVEAVRGGAVFNEYVLMSVASIGAFCIGEYPEAVGVMLFYCVGEYLQDRAVNRSRRSVEALLDLTPARVRVHIDNEWVQRDPKEVAPGSRVMVAVGERVALDGVLLGEAATLDASALTGESLPLELGQGDRVRAGMIAVGSAVHILTTHAYEDSSLSRILKLVEEAAERKAPAETFVRKFARVYTPIVIALAVLIAVVPPLIVGREQFDAYVYRALVFLVISCPCALVLSIPLGYFAGIGLSSRQGVLFKGGNYLDAIARAEAVVFDKTGTLTTGEFRIKEITVLQGDEREAVGRMAAMEAVSTHPLAQAITAYAREMGLHAEPLEGAVEQAGKGVYCREWFVGRASAVGLPAEGGATEVVLARTGEVVARVSFTDTVRPDAGRAVDELHRLGIGEVGIVSGDREEIVAGLAVELGVDFYKGGCTPEDKTHAVRELKRRTVFVGDGINDAPVLAAADVGVAMGGIGSDAAIETADVVIQGLSPSSICSAIRVGRLTRRIVATNIAFALATKAIFLVLGALGLLGLWWAVFADTGVALLCVANVVVAQSLFTGNKTLNH